MSDLKLIDYAVIGGLASDLGMTQNEVITFFLESLEVDVNQSFSEMKAAFEANDVSRLQRAAHKMKGSCHTLGAVAAANIAKTLETTNLTELDASVQAMVQRLETTWQSSVAELHNASS
jgi:HPt (histidine-containing phosphotransfer) domain-containing protein